MRTQKYLRSRTVCRDDAELDQLSADPNNPSVDPVPYTGVQFVAIPEFAGIGTQVGQEFSAAYWPVSNPWRKRLPKHRPSPPTKWKPQVTKTSLLLGQGFRISRTLALPFLSVAVLDGPRPMPANERVPHGNPTFPILPRA